MRRPLLRRPKLQLEHLESRTTPAILPIDAADLAVVSSPVNEGTPEIAMKPDGSGFVVVWQAPDGDGNGIFFSLYDANWQPISSKVRVNASLVHDQQHPSIGMDNAGNFVIAWQSPNQVSTTSSFDIYARRFDHWGFPIDVAEFLVNTTTANAQMDPDVAVDGASGKFAITWWGGTFLQEDVFIKQYAGITVGGSGSPTQIYGETMVNNPAASPDDQGNPAVALDSAGNAVVVWDSFNQDAADNGFGVYFRRVNANGTLNGNEVLVNTGQTAGIQQRPDIAMDAAGNFVIVWQSANVDGDGMAIVQQRYSATAVPQGANSLVNTTTTGDQRSPHVARAVGGDYVITWSGEELDFDGLGSDIFFKKFSSAGTALIGETLVNTGATAKNDLAQDNPAPAINAAGDFVIATESAGGTGGSSDIVMRRFGEAPVVQYTFGSLVAFENNSPLIVLNRSGASYVLNNLSTSVQVTRTGGTATPGSDFNTTFPLTATFASGQSSVMFSAGITNDTIDEPDQTIILGLTTSALFTIGATNAHTYTILDDELPPTISVSNPTVTEGSSGAAGEVSFTINLSAASEFTVSANAATANGTATTADNDYAAVSGTVMFTPGVTSGIIQVSIHEDTKNEADETFTLNLTGATNAANATASGTATITNDDPVPSLAIGNAGLTEGNSGTTTATFTVTLSAVSGQTVTVNYATANGTATAGSDFVAASGTLTFAPAQATQTITITVNGDLLNEANETFTVTLSSPTNAGIGTGTGTGTITNDDPVPVLSINNVSVTEGNSGTTPATFTVSLSAVSGQTVTVNYATANGTATAGSDFVATSGTLTFAPGQTSQTITVAVNGDTTTEANETFTVNLTGPVNATISGISTGTIVNDDADVSVAVSPASVTEDGAANLVYTFTRVGVTTGSLTVNFGVSGSATFGTDYTASGSASFNVAGGTVTFAAGSSTATVTLDPTADTPVESDETAILTLTSGTGYNVATPSTATGTITNDDTDVSVTVSPPSVSEDGLTSLVYAFTRTGFIDNVLTVNFDVSGSATFGTDYTQTGAMSFTATGGTVIFEPGSTTLIVSLDPIVDSGVESDETAILTVTSGTSYSVGSPSAATGTITNDDIDVTVAVSSVSADEDGTTNLVYTFTRTGFTADALTVNFGVSGSATFGSDYTASGAASFSTTSGTVTFAAGSSTATITFDPTADVVDETDEAVTLTVTSGTGYNIASPSAATSSIADDDDAPAFSIDDVTVNEGSGTATFTITRTGATALTTSVDFATADDTALSLASDPGTPDFEVGSGTLTFPASLNATETQTVTVALTDDDVYEALELFLVNLTDATNATIADSQGVATITDNDSAPTFSIDDVTVNEADGTATFTVTLTGPTALTATVDYTTADDTALSLTSGPGTPDFEVGGATLTFGPSSEASQSQTVTVALVNDTTNEASEQFFVNLSVATFATISDAQGVATVIDDDPFPTISIDSPSVTEGDSGTTTVTFTVTLSAASAQSIRVDYATADGAATTTDGDYDVTSGSLTFLPGETSATFTVTINGDTTFESDESFTVTLSNPVNVTIPTGAETGTATITNDDPIPTVTLSITGSPLAENGGVATVTATLSNPSAVPVTVDLAFTGTAAAAEYAAASQIVIDPNTLTGSITLTGLDDDADENDETVIVDVVGVTNGTEAGSQQVTATVTDDDQPVATANADTTAEEMALVVADSGVLGDDNAAPGSTVELVAGPAHGTLTLLPGGGFTYTPDADFNGTDSFEYQVRNAANEVSSPATVTLTVTAVNDAPTFVAGPNQIDPRRPGPQTVDGWATGISTGPADEVGQGLTFLVTTDNPALFEVLPAIDPATGTLTYTPVKHEYGTATVTVRLQDDGGTADGGSDTSAVQTFTITVMKHKNDDREVSQNEFSQFAVGTPGSVTVYSSDGTAVYTVNPFANDAEVRVAFADVTGDGVPDVIAGTGPGVPARVVVIDGVTQQVVRTFEPFEPDFQGGVFIAAGDVNGDGFADVAVTPDITGGPRVVLFDGQSSDMLLSFLGIEDASFRGGARLAMGDVNADGIADLAVAAGFSGGPRVAIFDGAALGDGRDPTRLVHDFFAFEPQLRDGVFLTMGDLNGDGFDDLIFGGGPGGGPRVQAFDGRSLIESGGQFVVLTNYFADDPALRTGVRVIIKDFDGDRRGDLVMTVPNSPASDATVILGKDLTTAGGTETSDLDLFPGLSGVFIG